MPCKDPACTMSKPQPSLYCTHSDYWPGSAWPDLLQALEVANSTSNLHRNSPLHGSHESGQILIDRRRKWRSIMLSLFLAAHKDVVYQRTLRDGVVGYGIGEKEILPLALESTRDHFFKVPVPISSVGDSCGAVGDEKTPGLYSDVDQCSTEEMQNQFAGHAMGQSMPGRRDGDHKNGMAIATLHRNCLKLSPARPAHNSDCNKALNDTERTLRLARAPEPGFYHTVARRSWYQHTEMRTSNGALLHQKPIRAEFGPGCRASPHGEHVRTVRFYPDFIPFDIESEMERMNCELAGNAAWQEYKRKREGRYSDHES